MTTQLFLPLIIAGGRYLFALVCVGYACYTLGRRHSDDAMASVLSRTNAALTEYVVADLNKRIDDVNKEIDNYPKLLADHDSAADN